MLGLDLMDVLEKAGMNLPQTCSHVTIDIPVDGVVAVTITTIEVADTLVPGVMSVMRALKKRTYKETVDVSYE